MKRKTASRKGAAMLWAVLVMLMISLISGGIVFIDHVYYTREQEENNKMQAKLYAESAIELVAEDIQKTISEDGTVYVSPYISTTNSSQTISITFPEASNWDCGVTISHSVVDTSSEDTARKSGEIYLTAKVTRDTSSGKALELSEVCAKLMWNTTSNTWEWKGYYNL